MAVTQISDVVVPERFSPYTQQLTEEKNRLIDSGAVVRDASIDALLAGGGLTFDLPSWTDLANEEEDISNDDDTDLSSPSKIGTGTEIAVRLNRNKSWSSMDLTAVLAGADPLAAVGNRVANYWKKRQQALFIATATGVFNNNEKATPGGGAVQNDLTHDISDVAYSVGVTDFSAEAVLATALTMGDSMDDLTMVFMHSVVYSRAQALQLIDYIPDANGVINIPRYLGRTLVIDDGMPNANGVFETWFFAGGAFRLGVGKRQVPTAVVRVEAAGNGSGQETLHNRVQWLMHPTGYKYNVAAPASGGPSNANTTGNLAHADSWQRVYPERKQIKIARLISREY
jgi:hypothetical protein